MKRSTQTIAILALAALLGASAIAMVGSSTNASLIQWVEEWDEVPME